MSLANFFNWNSSTTPQGELPEVFPLAFAQNDFILTDVINVFTKILTDVLDRVHGLTPEQTGLLWDNCVQTEASDGLITLLAKAMTDKQDLFIVFEKAVNVVRKATFQESEIIRADYLKKRESSSGVFISFKNYTRSDMMKLYSALEYCTVSSLYKQMNLSKAIQFKVSDLRGTVSLNDSAVATTQAIAIAEAMAKGRDVMLDAKDLIETSVPDLTAVEASMKFLNQKRSFYLGLPEAYINGEQTGGLGTTGENDTKATERGLKNYFLSIMKPVLDHLFDLDVSYKSQDFRQIKNSMDVLKVFSMSDDSIVSLENKTKIMNQLLDLPEDSEGDAVPPPPAPVLPAPGAAPVIPPAGFQNKGINA